jgi:predicted RNase H-like nuclease (RuvC/YqgF family)
MPAPGEHTHHIRVRNTQLEMGTITRGNAVVEDYDDKLEAAKVQLQMLEEQRLELERKKREVEALEMQKRDFIGLHAELSERLSSTVTRMEREIFNMRQELDDLEQCRKCFANHVTKLEKIKPESWTRENLPVQMEKAMALIEQADDEYALAAEHFAKGRSGEIFQAKRRLTGSDFGRQFKNGLAFNLPLIILGVIALVVYFIK